MAILSYVSERQVPDATRAWDPDRILKVHSIHPPAMRQRADPCVDTRRRPGP